MNDFDPTSPSLELSQDEIRSLYMGLAAALIQHGEVSDNPGVYGPEDGSAPFNFTYNLSAKVVRDIFYPTDEGLSMASGSYIRYATPHRMEPNEGEPSVESILLVLRTKLVNSEIECNQFISLDYSNGIYGADFDTEYVDKGERVSPNDIPHGAQPDDYEAAVALGEDLMATMRPLVLEDAEKLRKIEALIAAS